jgi:hypothetical protein
MQPRIRVLAFAATALWLLGLAGCATQPPPAAPAPTGRGVLAALALDRALEDRILALDPERIGPDDVKNTLARGPTPRIILLHGGIYPVHLAMESFGEFLTGMGYPEARIRHPGDRRWSHSPYENAAQIAGFAAWAYERDGMTPMLVGHSQGGIQVMKVLRELDGAFAEQVAVWDPLTDSALERTTIVDPLTGQLRPVRGLTLSYASAAAAGGAALILPNQWSMIGNVRLVPNTVQDFTGYSIVFDTWAWTNGMQPDDIFRAAGTARVRNVELPWTYNHVVFPVSSDFPKDPTVRAWIEAYTPAAATQPAPLEAEGRSVLWAADVWYSVRKHWCLEAQQLIRARRSALGASGRSG